MQSFSEKLVWQEDVIREEKERAELELKELHERWFVCTILSFVAFPWVVHFWRYFVLYCEICARYDEYVTGKRSSTAASRLSSTDVSSKSAR